MESFTNSTLWRWDWTSLCGPEDLNIWSPITNDLGLCFQQLCLQIPALSLLACVSAYYFGRNGRPVIRGAVQILSIYFRCFMVLIMAALPILQIYIDLYNSETKILKISYFLSVVQGFTWIIHFVYCLSLRRNFGLSPRGPVLICVIWSIVLVLTIISLRSHYLRYKLAHQPDFSFYLSYTFSIGYCMLQVMYAMSLIPGKGDTVFTETRNVPFNEENENTPLLPNRYISFLLRDHPFLGEAMEDSGWISKLFFTWVYPLLERGEDEMLVTSEDLFDLPPNLCCEDFITKMDNQLSGTTERAGNQIHNPMEKPDRLTLLKSLHRCFWIEFYGVGILKFLADCSGFAGPLLLNRLVGFIENKQEPIGWGYVYAAGLASSTLIGALCDSHFQFRMAIVGLKMRTALVTTIFRKVLKVKGSLLNSSFSVGEIVNFMSVDTDRIVNSCPSFHAVWSIPFQLAVTLYLLYMQVGVAFIAGVAFSIALIPINKFIASKIGQLSTELMTAKDSRVKVTTEVLRGIKTVKLYVWEQHFIRCISKLREVELKYLRGRKYLDALCVYFWATTPVLISILTFGTYVVMGNQLTAATVFTGIALLNMLISPLNAFPWVLNGLTEAWVSLKRMQKLLNLPEEDLEQYYSNNLLHEYPDCDIVINNGSFNWGKTLSPEEKKQLHASVDHIIVKGKSKGKSKHVQPLEVTEEEERTFALKNLNIRIKKGELVGIIGSVGSGKSSLLSAIIGELNMTEGDIASSDVEEGFGFVTQQSWLQQERIIKNITFGKTYDEQKYKSVLHACGLAEDIQSFVLEDRTCVGEGGTTLSGGQKARIALARAVYQDKSVYLLDDILSAVDKKVAKHIFEHCILTMLKDKTRILCTHLVEYLAHADWIVWMENGEVKQQGPPKEVLKNFKSGIPFELELTGSTEYHSTYEGSLSSSNRKDPEESFSDDIFHEENEKGTIDYSVFRFYFNAVGAFLVVVIFASIILMQGSRNMTDVWLSNWVTTSENTPNKTNISSVMNDFRTFLTIDPDFVTMDYYLKVYIELAIFNSVFTLLRAFLFAYGGVVAAAKIHRMLLKSILKAHSSFFDVSPVGRIQNRFSSDIYTTDDSLPFIMNILLAQFFGLLGTLIVTIYGLPWICLVLVPLIPVYSWLQYMYRVSSRELKRISSRTLSPIYSNFNETLQGLPTIRAMRASKRFISDNELYVKDNITAQFSSQAAARWLGLRLQFIGVIMVTGVSFVAVVQHHYKEADPGLIGLALSYALTVTGSLGGVINAFTETEREMIAVERVNQYVSQVPLETTFYSYEPPFGWPSQGVIIFENVVLKYRNEICGDNNRPSLCGVTFRTRPCEKIGVVGRTGAGKSSLITALFRLVEVDSGAIYIDTINIRDVALSSLRSRMFCIPQEPFLFSGSIRDNLDPLGEFRDDDIWSALTKVNLSDTMKSLGGLTKEVGTGGTNFSVGEKQLICLARAVLHNAKILCIDEATANVDYETDRLIQSTLRTAFRQSTVLTIAHRIETILDSDRILVLVDGMVLEFDTPDNLLDNKHSHFYSMVNGE